MMRPNPALATVLILIGAVLSARAAAGGGAHRAAAADAAPAASPPGPAADESPLACNVTALTPKERTRHFDELGPRLRSLKTGVRELPDGYEFAFPGDAATYRLLAEWAAGERVCCPFFDIDLRSPRESGTVLIALTGRPGVKQFIEVDGAAWLKR